MVLEDAAHDLPDSARPAWNAYRELLGSKSAYFDFLALLANKYQFGGQRSLAEIARLETLLAAHTAAVKAFKSAVSDLGQADATARDRLVELLGRVNEGLGNTQSSTTTH